MEPLLTNEEIQAITHEQFHYLGRIERDYTSTLVLSYEYTSKRGKILKCFIDITSISQNIDISITFPPPATKEMTQALSELLHDIEQAIKQQPFYRLRFVTGEMSFSYSGAIAQEVKRQMTPSLTPASMKKADVFALKSSLVSFYQQAKGSTLPKDPSIHPFESSVVLVSGREGKHLLDLLKDMHIATGGKWDKFYRISFHYDQFISDRHAINNHFCDEFIRLGFKAHLHAWYS